MIKTPKSLYKVSIAALCLVAAVSCKNGKSDTGTSAVIDSAANVDSVKPPIGENPKPGTDSIFNINSVPISTKVSGEFPYLTLPASYTFNYEKAINPSNIKDIDKEYFAVYGKLISKEGRTFKATLEKNRSDGKRFNKLDLQRAIDKSVADFGGIKLKTVAISDAEWKRIGAKELIENKYGYSIDSNSLDDIQTYVIRTKTKEIWIQVYLLNDESGRITVLEQAAASE